MRRVSKRTITDNIEMYLTKNEVRKKGNYVRCHYVRIWVMLLEWGTNLNHGTNVRIVL